MTSCVCLVTSDAQLLRFISLFAQDEGAETIAREKRDSISAASFASAAPTASSTAAQTKASRLSLSRTASEMTPTKSSSRSAAAVAKLADAVGSCLKVVGRDVDGAGAGVVVLVLVG